MAAGSEVAKYQNYAKQRPARVANGSGAIIDRSFDTVLSDQERVIRQPDNNAGAQHFVDRVLSFLAGFFIDDPKHGRKLHSNSFGARPACELLRLGIDK